MPIQKQVVNVSLTAGINKKRDSHQLQNGELLTGDNIIYSAVDGQVTKRYGYASITPSGGPFPGAPFNAIGCRDNMEPLFFGDKKLVRYNVAQNTANALAAPTTGRLRMSQIGASSGQTQQGATPIGASMAFDGDKNALVVWHEVDFVTVASGQYENHLIYFGVQDVASGTWVQSPRQFTLAANATDINVNGISYSPLAFLQPMARYANGQFYIFCVQLGVASAAQTSDGIRFTYSVVGYRLPTNALGPAWNRCLTAPMASRLASSAIPRNVCFDVALSGGKAMVVSSHPTATSFIRHGFYSTTGAQFTELSSTTLYGTSAAGTHVAARADGPAANPFLSMTSFWVTVFNADYSVKYSHQAASQFTTKPVDCAWQGSNFYALAYGAESTGTVGRGFVYTPSGTSYTPTLLCSIAGPTQSYFVEYTSRLFFAPDGTPMIWLNSGGSNSDLSSNAAFLVQLAPYFNGGNAGTLYSQVVARTLYLSAPQIGGGVTNVPCEVLRVPGTSKYVTALTSVTENTSRSYASYGVLNRAQFDFSPKRSAQILSLPTGGNMLAGPCPLYYDGNTVNEAGFSTSPDYTLTSGSVDYASAPGAVTVADAGGFGGISGGTQVTNPSGKVEYYYTSTFVRRDAYGNVYRSAPSPVLTVVCPNALNTVTFHGLNYRSGGEQNGSAQNVNVEFYRTALNAAGTYYFVGQAPLGQDFTDSLPDLSITRNRTVYTNSGELPNDPPPACHHATVGEQRAYMIPSDARNLIWYSKQFSPGRTVEWCAALTLSEGLNSGQFTAVQVLDSNVIVFKEDAILFFYGTGPDNTGAGGGFSPFQKIATDVGCIDPGSIAVLPDGITFRSRRGIELLTRSLQVVYIGNNVEPIVQTLAEIVSVVCMPGFTELRFVTADPNAPVLCYDYGGKRWSTFSGVSARQAANLLGQYWWLSPDGMAVNRETVGGYLDNGKPIRMTLETAEIPVGSAGSQGWGRIYRMALLGDFFSDHRLTVEFAYDHASAYTDAVVWDTKAGLINGDAVYQFRLSRLPRSVMQSARIRITDSDLVGSGQACAISNLVLEIADKSGLARLLAAKTL